MNISLTPELGEYVAEQVSSGRYRSASEFIRECVRLKMDQDQEREMKLAALREAIAQGVRELDAGDWIPASVAFEQARQAIRDKGDDR